MKGTIKPDFETTICLTIGEWDRKVAELETKGRFTEAELYKAKVDALGYALKEYNNRKGGR